MGRKGYFSRCLWVLVIAGMLTACAGGKEKEAGVTAETVEMTETAGEAEKETDGGQKDGGEDGQEASLEGQEDEKGSQEASQSGRISQVLADLEWDKRALYLPEVQEKLDEAGVVYQGIYNRSGERIDLTLSDGTKLLFLATRNFDGDDLGYELMMCGDWFNEPGFQENYQNHYDVTLDEEYYPETKSQKLNPDNLVNNVMKQNQTNLSIARNEIFARHGRKFQDPFLQAVFQRKSWYQPLYDGEEFSKMQSELLNEVEKENIEIITRMEQDYGYRLPDGADYGLPECILSGSWVDLDGDGKAEKICYEILTEPQERYILTVDGQEAGGSGRNLYGYLYMASLDGVQIQLLAATAGDSADYSMEVYGYENGRLEAKGTLAGAPESVYLYGDRFSTSFQHDFFQTFPTRETYELRAGSIVRIDQGWYEFGNEASAIAEIPLYQDQGGEAAGIVLHPGDDVIILGTDYKEWVAIRKKSTGEKGWLRCEKWEGDEEAWGYTCVMADGKKAQSHELFEGLLFYG